VPEHAGFLRDIIANPDDDAPRLIYADWLDDHGERARAAFIRAQCHLARICIPEIASRAFPAGRLLPELRSQFLGSLLALGLEEAPDLERGVGPGFRFSFRRGFVEDLVVFGSEAAEQFVDHAERLFALTPLRDLCFVSTTCSWQDHKPYHDPLSLETLQRLVGLPELGQLLRLKLSWQEFRDDAASVLLASPLSGRTTLLLEGNRFSPAAEQALRERFGDRIRIDEPWPDEDSGEAIPY